MGFLLIVSAVPSSILIRRVVRGTPRVDPLTSGPAPAFSLPALDGRQVSLADYAGRPVVVNFWATWCKPCIDGLPTLATALARHPGLAMVGIVFRDTPSAAARAVSKAGHGVTWPELTDADGRAAADYHVASAPAVFFVRADGTIASDLLGPVSVPIVDKEMSRITGG